MDLSKKKEWKNKEKNRENVVLLFTSESVGEGHSGKKNKSIESQSKTASRLFENKIKTMSRP